jgi:hypothetical protein
MPNGSGVASGGSFNHWDVIYNGSGDTTVDGAPLSGGVGKLTVGVATDQPWLDVSNVAGTGPYVGWRELDPQITVHLADVLAYDAVWVHVDNSFVGRVSAPASITVSDGTNSRTFGVAPGPPAIPSGPSSTSPRSG